MMFRRCCGYEDSLTIRCAEGTDILIITYACGTQVRNLCPALLQIILVRVEAGALTPERGIRDQRFLMSVFTSDSHIRQRGVIQYSTVRAQTNRKRTGMVCADLLLGEMMQTDKKENFRGNVVRCE
jgi:hypothetical protein